MYREAQTVSFAVKAGMRSLYELYINSSVFPVSVVTNSLVEKSTEGIAFFSYVYIRLVF